MLRCKILREVQLDMNGASLPVQPPLKGHKDVVLRFKATSTEQGKTNEELYRNAKHLYDNIKTEFHDGEMEMQIIER